MVLGLLLKAVQFFHQQLWLRVLRPPRCYQWRSLATDPRRGCDRRRRLTNRGKVSLPSTVLRGGATVSSLK